MTCVLGIGHYNGLFHTALQKVGFSMFMWKWRGGSYSGGAVGSVIETDLHINSQ
jgi:hypothetical protein